MASLHLNFSYVGIQLYTQPSVWTLHFIYLPLCILCDEILHFDVFAVVRRVLLRAAL